MSLTLLQGYSSPEEDQEEGLQSSEEEEQEDASSLIHDQRNPAPVKKSRKFSEASNFPHGVENLPSSSSLPSALDAFSKVDTLKNSIFRDGFSLILFLSGDFWASRVSEQHRGENIGGIE